MLASVLSTPRAVDVSVYIVRAFVRLREMVAASSKEVAARLDKLDRMVAGHDGAIRSLVTAIRQLMAPAPGSRRRIGFRVEEPRPRYRVRRLRGAGNARAVNVLGRVPCRADVKGIRRGAVGGGRQHD